MRCRFVEDPRIVIGLFTHGLTTRLRNEVLKSCPSEVDEAYRIVEHMERLGDDAPVTTTTQTAWPRSPAPRRLPPHPSLDLVAGTVRLPRPPQWDLPHPPGP